MVTPLLLDATEVADAAVALEDASAEEVLQWAVDNVPRLAVTTSAGADSAVLLHLVAKVAPDVPVLFGDTGYHFAETLTHRDRIAARLGLQIIDVKPQRSVAEQDAALGRDLFARDPDQCCGLRKIAPLDAVLAEHDGWVTGIRRAQTPDRRVTPVVEFSTRIGHPLVKVAPLARWSDADVAAYLAAHDLPAHPLVAKGFRSIGCAPCTRPALPGEDPRAGRWEGLDKTECGLHPRRPGA